MGHVSVNLALHEDIIMNTSSNEIETPDRNRYRNAVRNPDFTIDQDWASYTQDEHDRWDRLFARMQSLLPERACTEFLEAMTALRLSQKGIPNMERLSERLFALTGWTVVPVAGLVPDDVFFEHLANRRFPAGAFLRSEAEFDYLEEPDIFHDIFGHVPLLAVPVFADFLQAYGRGGLSALEHGQLHNLARLYWYTVEFGLIQTPEGLRIFGAGILSSPDESKFSLESPSPNRIGFNLERIMRTNYIIDDYQQSYFIIESFEDLLEDCYDDFNTVYTKVKSAKDIAAHEIIDGDTVLHTGSLEYFKTKQAETKQ